MSLLDRLRAAQQEPARHRSSPWVGPSILSLAQLRAMERVLLREKPDFVELASTGAEAEVREPSPVTPEPLPLWTPPEEFRIDVRRPSPVRQWPPRRVPRRDVDPCPNCGEEAAIVRIDLTANAGWMHCRSCGLRWGGAIRRRVEIEPLPPVHDLGERDAAAAG